MNNIEVKNCAYYLYATKVKKLTIAKSR